MWQNDDTFLDVLDLVACNQNGSEEASANLGDLDATLAMAGSVWHVMLEPLPYLARRVSEELQGMVQAVVRQGGRPGDHLSAAWKHVYGRDPDSTAAYRDAVRAVEAAARPIVSPNSQTATLGTMIGEVRSDPSRWRVVIAHAGPQSPMVAVKDMMELLWKGQIDRHGTPDLEVPANVSLAEAEAAVQLATLLVQWFVGGQVSHA